VQDRAQITDLLATSSAQKNARLGDSAKDA
jgi:hypothetical protein